MAYGDRQPGIPDEPDKGLEGGACNRQLCQARPANWYNHGSGKWYCVDCARDIGQDSFNLRDWELNWRPKCGHAMFETREEIDEREKTKPEQEKSTLDDIYDDLFVRKYPSNPACRPKEKSSSLKRMLGRKHRYHER